MHIEHIVPLAEGGSSNEDNLWLACPLCNLHKGIQTHAADPATAKLTRLFHPRQQRWSEHFEWSNDGVKILGKTDVGRATISALRLNNDLLMRARQRWVLASWHPPND